jgi:serine phosphatase RsbU (regulator of sigma subunit)/anti-sigma regulatory factor (Ser/Thr protein kinase)
MPFDAPTITAEVFRDESARVMARDDAESGSTTRDIFDNERLQQVAYVAMPGDGVVNFGWRDVHAIDPGLLRALVDALGAAIRRAALAERERSALTEVQRALLPEIRVPNGAAIATRYEPAADVMRLGGDWYDVFAIDEHRIGVAVGDVVGHGLTAAAAMGKLKSAVRALATVIADPVELLDHLDEFAMDQPPMIAATVFFGVLDRAASTLQYCCAGHPPPLLADCDGTVTVLDGGRRTPLGVTVKRPPAARAAGHVTIAADETLLLYTDGLVERRGQSIDVGIARLAQLLEKEHERSVDALADILLGELLPSDRRDDTALVCLRFVTPRSRTHTWHVPSNFRAVGSFRRDLARWLEDLEVRADVRAEIGLVASEAVANAIEHGYRNDPTREVVVDAEVGETIEMTIRDEGEWIPPVRRPDRGRGLSIMESLTDDVTVDASTSGTVVRLTRDLRRPPAPAGVP